MSRFQTLTRYWTSNWSARMAPNAPVRIQARRSPLRPQNCLAVRQKRPISRRRAASSNFNCPSELSAKDPPLTSWLGALVRTRTIHNAELLGMFPERLWVRLLSLYGLVFARVGLGSRGFAKHELGAGELGKMPAESHQLVEAAALDDAAVLKDQ